MVINCCKYFLVPAILREDVLTFSFLQPFTGGPSQNVSCELNKGIYLNIQTPLTGGRVSKDGPLYIL